jgi:hypothetical protein
MKYISNILRFIIDRSSQSRKEAQLQIEANQKLIAWVYRVEKRLADLEGKRGVR